MLFTLYRLLSRPAQPLVTAYFKRRAQLGKEDSARLGERFGFASRPRPEGNLTWIHASGLTEAMAALPLVTRLRMERKDLHILITTSTVPSAELLISALPAGVSHQYLPADIPPYVNRFLKYWRPNLALWIETGFWPYLLHRVGAMGIPLILLNGRMSDRAFRWWRRIPQLIRHTLSQFTMCLAGSPEDAHRLRTLGAPVVEEAGNLKFSAPPLAADTTELNRLAEIIGRRPRWLAAHLHPSDEDSVLTAHRWLLDRVPDLLTVIVPRHPRHANQIVTHALRQGLRVARRSLGQLPDRSITLYLADTIGEMGLWYRLCSVVFIGGSLAKEGGHSPLEAARLSCAILTGPNTGAHTEIYTAMHLFGAARQVEDEEVLTEQLNALLFDEPGLARAMGQAAEEFAENRSPALNQVMERLEPFLPPNIQPLRKSVITPDNAAQVG